MIWARRLLVFCLLCFYNNSGEIFVFKKIYGSTWRFLFEACVATSVLFLILTVFSLCPLVSSLYSCFTNKYNTNTTTIYIYYSWKKPKCCWKISTSNLQIYENGYEIIYKFVGSTVPRNCNSNDSYL